MAILSCALALVVTLAQSLGLAHRVGHGAGPTDAPIGAGHDVSHAALAWQDAHAHAHEHHDRLDVHGHGAGAAYAWVHDLLSGHAEGSDCLGFDHALAADLLAAVPIWLPLAATAGDAVPDALRVWHLAETAAGYLARGPPLLS